MVSYMDPFIPLIETYPYDTVIKSGKPILREGSHQVRVGWLSCPCKPIEDCPPVYKNWGACAYQHEIWEYKEDDYLTRVGYLHQHPVFAETYQSTPQGMIFIRLVLDSCGIMGKATMSTWEYMILRSPHNSIREGWHIIVRKERIGNSPTKTKRYLLVNKDLEYEIRDGIMIEYMDVVMEWLGL